MNIIVTKNEGKVFEANFQSSAKAQIEPVFFERIKDISLPPHLRLQVKLPKNKYDCYMFCKGYLFTLELKSTKQKSISFSESIIKGHQIEHLLEASKYDRIISGFIFNFREPDNKVYFVHIKDFVNYQNHVNGISPMNYQSKKNKSSIPISICEEIGLEIRGIKKKVNYSYFVNKFIDEAIEKYANKKEK